MGGADEAAPGTREVPIVDADAHESLSARAVALARRWVDAAAAAAPNPSSARLGEVLRDADGLAFTVGFVDGVMRPESLMAAAATLNRIAPAVPGFLPWHLRQAVRVGGALAPILPAPVVPIARRSLRDLVGHLIIDARPAKLGAAIERLRAGGARLNLNLLGEAVLGRAEADRRLAGIRELIERDDVDYVSVKVSAVMERPSMWAFDETVEEVVERLLPLFLAARERGTFVNLDMEEYRDLDLTIAVFTRLLEDPRLRDLEAGIVLQAYLPDALPALQELTAWARTRRAAGGAGIKVRLVKGANLPMERVDAVLHGWVAATYATKVDTDANYLRCLDWALRPEHTDAVRLGVAGHNLFDTAYAWLLAGERGVRERMEAEMLLGMAPGQVRAVEEELGSVLLYVPVVHPDEFDVAIGYLMRRLEETASPEHFLQAAFDLAENDALWERERDRFLRSVERAESGALATGPRRVQDRNVSAPVDAPILRDPITDTQELASGLTQVVLGIASSARDRAEEDPRAVVFGGAEFVETAVFATHESEQGAGGAPGFRNTADTDPALARNRQWARRIFERIPGSTAGIDAIAAARVRDADELDRTIATVAGAATAWGARPATERAGILRQVARTLEVRRNLLIEVAAAETGKVFAEADTEVSEAVDFANYYASISRELDRVPGAVFEPSRVTVVASPWNFPVAIPAGGVLAALAAGSGVVFKPAPQARRCAAVIAEACWEAGVPAEVLALVDLDEDELGRSLISHPAVDRVVLTGSWETARLFRSWRPELPLLAETSGKNSMIITPSADVDLAAADLVRSAFGHAGQKCSATSVAILVGSAGRSARLGRQLVDAVTSLRVAMPADPLAEVGPLIEAPTGALEWALTTLGDGERWLIEPRALDADGDRRLWTPGVRTGVQPGSRTHLEEFFGPVLGIMHAANLQEAIDLQNATAYGLTAGLHTRNPDELALWLDRVEAGNLYVNRGTTGAIVQRQPFGGWKRSSVGPGQKTGGPNALVALGSWRPSDAGASSSTLHLRGLDSRITAVIEAAQPAISYGQFEWLRRAALSDAVEWDREFGRVKDVSRLGVERNLFRYRPAAVAVRAVAGARLQEVLRVVVAGIRSGSALVLSAADGLPPAVRRLLSDGGVPVFVESDEEWIARLHDRRPKASQRVAAEPVDRVRLVGAPDLVRALRAALAEATAGDPDIAVYDGAVTTAGRLELLPFLREQSISITAHRFGEHDDWSQPVI